MGSSSRGPSIRNRIQQIQEVSDESRKSKLSLDSYSVIKNTNNMIQITDLENQPSMHSFADLNGNNFESKGSSIFKSKNSMMYASHENPDTFRQEISIQGLEGHNTLNTIIESDHPPGIDLRETIQYDT